jgi:hypothetical protein
MSNYNESEVTGVKWTRSSGGQFSNPYQGVPSISFQEEELITFSDGSVIKQPSNSPYTHLSTSMTDQSREFDLLNPMTGEVIGVSKFQDVFVILHSLYMSLAKDRDGKISPINIPAV